MSEDDAKKSEWEEYTMHLYFVDLLEAIERKIETKTAQKKRLAVEEEEKAELILGVVSEEKKEAAAEKRKIEKGKRPLEKKPRSSVGDQIQTLAESKKEVAQIEANKEIRLKEMELQHQENMMQRRREEEERREDRDRRHHADAVERDNRNQQFFMNMMQQLNNNNKPQ
jgi:hypothetical protein